MYTSKGYLRPHTNPNIYLVYVNNYSDSRNAEALKRGYIKGVASEKDRKGRRKYFANITPDSVKNNPETIFVGGGNDSHGEDRTNGGSGHAAATAGNKNVIMPISTNNNSNLSTKILEAENEALGAIMQLIAYYGGKFVFLVDKKGKSTIGTNRSGKTKLAESANTFTNNITQTLQNIRPVTKYGEDTMTIFHRRMDELQEIYTKSVYSGNIRPIEAFTKKITEEVNDIKKRQRPAFSHKPSYTLVQPATQPRRQLAPPKTVYHEPAKHVESIIANILYNLQDTEKLLEEDDMLYVVSLILDKSEAILANSKDTSSKRRDILLDNIPKERRKKVIIYLNHIANTYGYKKEGHGLLVQGIENSDISKEYSTIVAQGLSQLLHEVPFNYRPIDPTYTTESKEIIKPINEVVLKKLVLSSGTEQQIRRPLILPRATEIMPPKIIPTTSQVPEIPVSTMPVIITPPITSTTVHVSSVSLPDPANTTKEIKMDTKKAEQNHIQKLTAVLSQIHQEHSQLKRYQKFCLWINAKMFKNPKDLSRLVLIDCAKKNTPIIYGDNLFNLLTAHLDRIGRKPKFIDFERNSGSQTKPLVFKHIMDDYRNKEAYHANDSLSSRKTLY